MTTTKNWAAGIWKFKKVVGEKALADAAEGLIGDNEELSELIVRQIGPDELGLQFMYQGKSEEDTKAFLESSRQYLQEKFSTQLTGWGISTELWIVLRR